MGKYAGLYRPHHKNFTVFASVYPCKDCDSLSDISKFSCLKIGVLYRIPECIRSSYWVEVMYLARRRRILTSMEVGRIRIRRQHAVMQRERALAEIRDRCVVNAWLGYYA